MEDQDKTEWHMSPEEAPQLPATVKLPEQNFEPTMEQKMRQLGEGFPSRMKEAAMEMAAKLDAGMSMGQWFEIADAASHTGRVLFKHTPEAEEFAVKYVPKLNGDAGIDIYCIKDAVIEPGQYHDLPSGVFIAMPHDWYAEVRARSSTSKRMIHVYPGIIDPGYRGEMFTCVQNLGSVGPVYVKRGDRLAQLIFHKRVEPTFENVGDLELPKTERGERGFGSTNQEPKS